MIPHTCLSSEPSVLSTPAAPSLPETKGREQLLLPLLTAWWPGCPDSEASAHPGTRAHRHGQVQEPGHSNNILCQHGDSWGFLLSCVWPQALGSWSRPVLSHSAHISPSPTQQFSEDRHLECSRPCRKSYWTELGWRQFRC